MLWRNTTLFSRLETMNKSENSSISSTVCDVVVKEKEQTNIEPYTGEIASVDFESNPEAKIFHTAISEQVAGGANFAGHYTVATWGCGTECQGYAIVDLITGNIIKYEPHIPFQASLGLSSSVNSNVMVFNPRFELTEIKTAAEFVKSDYEAHKARIYYILHQDGYLGTLCVENLYSGQVR